MSQIYKIYQNVNNKIPVIYVFIGSRITNVNQHDNESLQKLFSSDPQDQIFVDIFSEQEFIDIQTNNIDILFVNDNIYIDDSIETVKKKLCKYATSYQRIAYDEIYLFYKQEKKLEAAIVYQELTQNETIELTQDRLVQFLLNISYKNIKDIPIKDIYTYDDIISLNLDVYAVNKSLGQEFRAVKKSYPYTVNPFDAVAYDSFLERNAEDITSTSNHSLVLNSMPIYNNTIYFCAAKEVLEYAMSQELSPESTIKIYYPYLFENKINSLDELEKEKETLLLRTEELLNKTFEKNIKDIKLFHDIEDESIEYKDNGINMIEFIIQPSQDFILPLDIVFKLIHASKVVPFIKFNPGRRKEKIYRLYAPTKAKNGKKIPLLKEGAVNKLIKTIGKEKSVAVYTYASVSQKEKHICFIEFYSTGAIYVKTTFSSIVDVADVNKMVGDFITPIINVVKNFLLQSGYSINGFQGIESNNVSILNINYFLKLPIEKELDIKKNSSCLSSIFNIFTSNVRKGAVMRFKRVANYNEMDGQEAFIITLLNNGNTSSDIIQGLMNNYKLTEESAREKIASFIDQLQVEQSANPNRKIKIKNNPGFLTTINYEEFSNNIIITVSNINDIEYLNTLPIYLDALIKITQGLKITQVSKQELDDLCSSKPISTAKDSKVDDVVAPVDSPETAALPLTIIADELQFEDIDEDKGSDSDNESVNMLDIIGSSDSDSEEEEEDSDSEGEGEGSDEKMASAKETYRKDLTGMKLNHPNPFSKRMEDRDPALFVYEDGGKYKAYSRACAWNLRRQPVILTQQEKDKIDRDHPGSYDQAVEYGSSPDKKYWYICPRYWSLRDNVSLTQEQVDSGEYGNIIPKNATTVPKDGNIIEFSSKLHEGPNNSYKFLYPGFLDSKIHPDGKCLPCCFKSWDRADQKRRREECTVEDEDERKTPKIPSLKRQASDVLDDYIKAPNKFPLAQTRLGFLPLAIQKFLNIDNKKCQISAANTNIKLNHKCILRYGVENNMKQSFISCIGTILPDQTDNPTSILTIEETKKLMFSALTLDLFITLQNGSLIENFGTPFSQDIDLEKYSDTRIYNITDTDNENQLVTLTKMINAYENFLNYLKDDKILIDYTYLWDLICKPNPKLFRVGINLVILKVTDNDITNNVELVCPSNHYSSVFFNENKPTVILIKKNDYYEPIIQYKETASSYEIKKRFNLKNTDDISRDFVNVLYFIKSSLNAKCAPLPSMPKVYKFQENISLLRMIPMLREKNYTVLSQIMNYNGKIVSLHIEKDGMKGILPCAPSSPLLDLEGDIIWMDSDYGYSYKDTINFLEFMFQDFDGKLPCKPKIKVIENNLIVGVLTQTNQFVMLSEPTQDMFGNDYPSVTDTNFNTVDKIAITDQNIDEERFMGIKKIKLETAFYRNFRNTIRIFLGTFQNREIKKQIEKIIDSPTMVYHSKLNSIVRLLKSATDHLFKFADYSNEIIRKLTYISSCYNAEDCKDKMYCFPQENNTCSLLIPKTNLINGMDNEEVYFGRLADELVRYQRIKSFIFQPKVFLTFEDVQYNLNNDEIILLQSLLTNNYFDDLIPMVTNKYVTSNAYDSTEPLKSQTYNNNISYNKTNDYKSEDNVQLDDVDKREDVNKKLKIKQIKKRKKYKNIKLKNPVAKEPDAKEPEAKEPEAKEPDAKEPEVKEPDAKEPEAKEPEAREPPLDECPSVNLKKVTGNWQKQFIPSIRTIEYKSSDQVCSYKLLTRIIQDNNQINVNKEELQNILLQEYVKYMTKYNIENIWKSQNKSKLFTSLKRGATLESVILNPDYFITNLDIWILAVKYDIPIIFISTKSLLENVDTDDEEEKKIFILNNDYSNNYYFIRPSATSQDGKTKAPSYRLFINGDKIKLPISIVSNRWQDYINMSRGKNNLDDFLLKGKMAKRKVKIVLKKD